jgi:predicted nucleic acid-binding protein
LALYYLETSALVQLYIRESGIERLLRLVAQTSHHRFVVLSLAIVEFHFAIQRRHRDGDLDASAVKNLLARFDQHLESRFIKQGVNDSLIDLAIGLLDRHALRAYDAVQLAGCLALKSNSGSDEPPFVCSDRRPLEAAELEGFPCLDASIR